MLDWIEDAVRYVELWLDYQMRATQTPGCVLAVAVDGALVRERAFGVADIGSGEALTPRHRFRVASHSKSFTAAGVLKLHEAGRLHLDEAVGKFVSGLDPATGAATIGQLLSHSAGLVRDGAEASFWAQRRAFPDEAELRRELAEPPTIEANTRFKYSNIGFGLLGLLIEAVTGERYVDWIQREIVAAFGLEETVPEPPSPEAAPIATGHSALLPLGAHSILGGDEATNALASATGFVSTAGDLARFFNALDPAAKQSPLSVSSRREMTRPHRGIPPAKGDRRYGLGVICGMVGERTWFGHSGGFPGFISRTATVPEWGVTASIVTNASDGPANPWLDGVGSIFETYSRRGKPRGATVGWEGRWWTLWGALDLVPVGDKVLVAAPARLDPFGEASELDVSSATQGRIVLADGFASHGEPVLRTFDSNGAPSRLRLGGGDFVPEDVLKQELAARATPLGPRASGPQAGRKPA